MSNQRYTPEFKDEAARLPIDSILVNVCGRFWPKPAAQFLQFCFL